MHQTLYEKIEKIDKHLIHCKYLLRRYNEKCKGSSVEETLVYMFSTYSKFEFSHKITKSQAFVLVFARKTTEFLTAKHLLPVT